jgi:polyphosphate kinase 2
MVDDRRGNMPSDDGYKKQLRDLQIELVKLQRRIIARGERVLVLLEGRDAAGKDGAIKRIVQHLSPRESRVVALGKPTERDKTSWYFQRWVAHLPAGGELVLFNRSWYNRAGVERVMGFCTDGEHAEFVDTVGDFERMLMRSGIQLSKYYLDISRDEQKKRIAERMESPLTQWKVSPIDRVSNEKWDDYSKARDEMFANTHSAAAPWRIVRADDKKRARLNLIRDLLAHHDYEDKEESLLGIEDRLVFPYAKKAVTSGWIAE